MCHRISSADMNRYIEDVMHLPVSAEDFRTWHGTGIAAVAHAGQFTAHDPDKPWT